jgi:hypothetical protein
MRGYLLSSQCIKLCIGLWSVEIRQHTIPSSRIPPFWKSRCRSSLHDYRRSLGSWKDWSSWSRWCCSSSLWWSLTITRFCMAILSWQSCRHGHLQGDILHLI